MQRKGRRGRRSDGGKDDGNNGGNGNLGEDELRFRFLTLLEGSPGDRKNAEREPVFMITAAQTDGSIETFGFSLRDTQSLIIDALITLHDSDNKFAKYLIDQYFHVDAPYPHNDWSRTELG